VTTARRTVRIGSARASLAVAMGAALAALACAGGGAPSSGSESAAPVAVASDAGVQDTLVRSCYGCHATGGTLPWSARLAPSAWFAGGARGKLDFSTWTALDASGREKALHSIARVVRAGEMPPWDSALLDGHERLTPDEKERVARWAETASASAGSAQTP
jgi:hypothetical protein